MNFDGVWTPVVTPFTHDNRVAFDTLKVVLKSLVEQQLHGLIIGGTTGEYYALTKEERKQVFDLVAEQVKGRIPIMAGVNATTTEESLELGLHAKAVGFDAILVAAPYYCQPAEDELLRHIQRVDDALDMPIMLYNFPDRTGVPMTLALIEALGDRPNIQAIKESTGSIERMHALINEFEGKIQVSCGMDDQALEFFVWGARSWVGGASNFLAAEHVALYKACVIDQDFVAGRELAARLLPMLNLLEQGGKFCQYIKFGCELAGLPVGAPRSPLMELNDSEKATFTRHYEALVAQRG